MPIQSFKEIIDSNDLKKIKSFLDSRGSYVLLEEEEEILQYCLKKKSDISIFKLIFSRFKNSKKDKVINRTNKDGSLALFLALDAGEDYFNVFKNYENIDWSVINKNGNNLLHYALSLNDVSEESLNFLYEKLGGYECIFKINNNSENILHCAKNLKNFKWCLDKCKTDASQIKSLLHSTNKVGETPVIKQLLKDKVLLDEALLKEVTCAIRENGYDLLRTDNNEQNAISLAVRSGYSMLLDSLLFDENDFYKKEKNEIIFSAIEYGEDDLLKILEIKDKGNFIIENFEELAKKYPKRLVNLVVNNQSILSDCIKLYETRNSYFTSDKLFSVLRRMMHLAVDQTNDKLAGQCLTEYKLFKNYVSFYEKNLVMPDLFEKQNSTDESILDYAYRSNPGMFARLVQRSSEFKSDISLRSNVNHEPNDTPKRKEEITSSIAGLFTSANSCEWHDTSGVLASLADLVIKENNDSPKIFVQPSTKGQKQSLSDELRKVSKFSQDVIYVRRNPINKECESGAHWIVLYFSQDKNGKHNLLVVDPYEANESSAVIKEAANGILDNICVSATRVQHDGNSCSLISSEIARAIYHQRGKLQELLERNNQKIGIEQILPNYLIKDDKENKKFDYEQRFENFDYSKLRNIHVQTAQAIGEAILNKIDTIPSQVLIKRILTEKEDSITEQTTTIDRDSIDHILNLCPGDNYKIKREIISILASKNITDEVLDQEIALLLSQDESKINQHQIKRLEQVLSKEQFEPIRERLNAQIQQSQLPQLSNEQKEKIRQVRRNFELELTNTTPQEYKSNDSLLYKFLCSAAVDDIEQFFDLNNNLRKGLELNKAAFTAARDGDISRLEAFIKCKSDIIYKEDISGKSLLEVAAENLHTEIVQYIIHKHNETCKDQNNRTVDELSSKFLGFVDNMGNRGDAWTKNLAKELRRILKKKDFDEIDILRISRIFDSCVKNKKIQEKILKNSNTNTNGYGSLSFYADILKSNDTEKFKTALEKIDPKHNLYSLLNGDGHNLITLTGALGGPDHWKEIEKAYSKVEGRTAISASLDNSSSIGSPIQAAIIASNLRMFNHFFCLKDGFVVNEQYGAEQNNILHTILQLDKAELINDIISKFRDNKKPFVKALHRLNKDNKSPLDLALEKGHYGFFERALDIITSCDKEIIRDLLIANDCGLIKSAVSFGNERIIRKIFSLQDEYNKGVKDKKDQLNLLNYNNQYDKGNRLKKSELLNLACKCGNKQVASYILKLLKDKEKVSSKILVNALTASISKDFSNKEIFDFLFGQGIDFNALSKEIITQYSPIHRAAEYGNINVLGYFINEFPKNNILNLQDEGGRTPLHLAISNSNRKTVEFLIENGADFDKSNNKGVTPFELALENNKFADICINLLKRNPKATMSLYRGISSGNESLIKSLIDQNDWVLDQCDRDNATRNHDFRNEETALKFALRRRIDKYLTAKIADKSIENFKELDKESQKNLLRLGFLNDIVKSSVYNLYPKGSKKAGEISEFIKSSIKEDGSLLSVASQGTTLLYDMANSGNFDLFRDIESDIGNSSIFEKSVSKKSLELEKTALYAAVRSDNASIVKTILETMGDQENIKFALNKYSIEGCTLFQMAAQLGNWEIYNLLKERGGNLKSKTKDGNSIAHLLILSAMKDPTDGSYEYRRLIKDYPELVRSINNRGDDLLATAARCTKQGKASKIMEQLLENEFKHKKNQLTEEDAVRFLSNAISTDNFDVIRKIVFNNIKERVPFANKVATVVGGNANDYIFQARVRGKIANIIASKKNIHGMSSEARVLSQSIQKALLSTKEQKLSLLQNILNFLHIKEQKDSFSNEVDTKKLLNFLIEDQNSYIKSMDGFLLIKEKAKISYARKEIFKNQKKLNKKNIEYQLGKDLSKIQVLQDALYTKSRDLTDKSIADCIFTDTDFSLINEYVFKKRDLWNPKFIDSKGNTLLHKLAQMIKLNKFKVDNLKDYVQLFIDRGFSLTRKNDDGESAKDIFEDIFSGNSDKEVISFLSERAKAEEQTQKYFEKGLNSLLENGSTDYLTTIIHNMKEEDKRYYEATFNLFHDVVSSCFNGDLSNDYIFSKKLNCFEKLLKNNDLNRKLDDIDDKRCNFLHKAIEEAANNHSGSSTNKMLKKILLDVARELNDKDSINRDPRLYNELFFKQRNSEGNNVIEALSKVQNSLDIFRELEEKFGRKAFADECDLNLLLINAVSSKNSGLFEHIIKNYRLNEFRTLSGERQSLLHAAVISGDQKTVLAVLKSGVDINQINSSGRNALHELLIFLRDNPGNQQEHVSLVNYLVSKGAFFCNYQKEGENKGGKVSEVIESMNEDIQKKVLFNIARGRSCFYDLKYNLLSEAENFIKSKNRNGPLIMDLDVSGSTTFIQINNGKFKSSSFLNSNICKSNHLTTNYFNVDGCKGYVQKSISGKRNYVIFEDAIDNEKRIHPTKIKIWLSKKQSITVLISADGTIEPDKTSYKVMGIEIKDYLLEYRERRVEFKKNHKKYEGYIEKLLEIVDSQNECKNDVYIGGIPLKEALMQGRWRAEGLQRQVQENKIEEIQEIPEDDDMQSCLKRNSKDDGMGKIIEDAEMDRQDPSKISQDLNQLQSILNDATIDNSRDSTFSAKEEKDFYEDAKEDIERIEGSLKDIIKDRKSENIQFQKKHSNFDKFVTELKESLVQLDIKELKRVDSSKYYANPKTLDGLIMDDLLKSSEYLESKKSSKLDLQILNSRKVESTQQQQVKIFTDRKEEKGAKNTRNREFYSGALELIEKMKILVSKGVDRHNYLKLVEITRDLISQISSQSEVINQSNRSYGAVTELSEKLEVLMKELINKEPINGDSSDRAKSNRMNVDIYNKVLRLVHFLDSLINKILKNKDSLRLRKSVEKPVIKVIYNNREKSIDLSIEKKMQRVGNSNRKLPESFEELKNKHPKLYEIVVRNRRDIESALKDIVLDISDTNLNSSNLSIPDSGYESGSKSPTQEEKGMNDNYNYKSEKSEIDIRYYRLPSKKHIIYNSGIELDGIEFEVEKQNSIPLIREGQKKEIEDIYEQLEKQRDVNNCSSGEDGSNEIQVMTESLTLQQNTKNYTNPSTRVQFNQLDTDYRNGKNIRMGKQPYLPISSSGDNKQEHIR